MTTKSVENGRAIRPEVLYIQPRHDDKKEEDMLIDPAEIRGAVKLHR